VAAATASHDNCSEALEMYKLRVAVGTKLMGLDIQSVKTHLYGTVCCK